MVEQATHIIDLARYLIGEVTDVYGRVGFKDRPEFPGLDVPAVTTASLTFQSGVIGNISSTCLLGWSHRVGLNIFADRLAIELTDHDIMIDVGAGRPVRHAEGDPVWREDRDFVDAVRGAIITFAVLTQMRWRRTGSRSRSHSRRAAVSR